MRGLILSILAVSGLLADTTHINGVYLDLQNNPIDSSRVYYSQDLVVVDSTLTNSSGYFNLTIDVVSIVPILPTDFKLGQNYPNPFNPSTRIDLTIKEPGRFSIYDISGALVETLNLPNAGSYELTWGGRNLGAGLYIYVLRSGSQSSSRKMILLDGGDGSGLAASQLSFGQSGKLSKPASNDRITFVKQNTSSFELTFTTPLADTSLGIIHGNVGPRLIQAIPDTAFIEGEPWGLDWNDYFYNDSETMYIESVFVPPDSGDTHYQVYARDLVDTTLSSFSNIFIVSEIHINEPPVLIGAIADTSINEDEALVIDLNLLFQDDDSELSYALTGLSDASYDVDATGVLSITPTLNWNGEIAGVVITASDGEYDLSSDPFSIEVLAVNDPPVLSIPAQFMVEDTRIDTLLNLLPYSFDVEGDSVSISLVSQGNPELVNLVLSGNHLFVDSLQADGHGTSIIGVRVFDGALADTSYFTLTVDPRADITFIMKDVCADTVMSSDTSRFFFDGVEYTSTNGILTRQLEPGTVEFDATNPNSIDGMTGTYGGTYLLLRFPGMINDFEERDRYDTSSPITPGTVDTTIICYKVPADFDIMDARGHMNSGTLGTFRVSDDNLFGPAWYNTALGVIDSTTRAWQQELFEQVLPAATGKLNLQYVEQDTAPGELGVDFYHETYSNTSIQHPQHGEDYNENNEITYALVRLPVGTSQYTRWSETFQSLGIRFGDPSGILQIVDDHVELTNKGHQWLRVLYQANPGFHF